MAGRQKVGWRYDQKIVVYLAWYICIEVFRNVYVKASAPGHFQELELGRYDTLAYIRVLITVMENILRSDI